jgi:hypothetical protein
LELDIQGLAAPKDIMRVHVAVVGFLCPDSPPMF